MLYWEESEVGETERCVSWKPIKKRKEKNLRKKQGPEYDRLLMSYKRADW